jgi:hypothetical protein
MTEQDDFSDLNIEDVTPVESVRQSRSSSTGAKRGRRSAKSKLDDLHKNLSSQLFMIGTMAGAVFPVTGYYTCQESDGFTNAVIELAAKRPEWIEALQHIADIKPGVVIARTTLGMGASLAVDRLRKDPERQKEFSEKQFLQFLGVTAAYNAVQANKAYASQEEGNAYQPPPSKFTPV